MKIEDPPAVVLVEDNESDVELTRRAFTKSNFAIELIVARDGEEALRLLCGPRDDTVINPALVLLDLKLPKVDGVEVLRRLRKNRRTRRLPVVVLSSSVEEKDLSDSYDNGANSYIRKSVDFAEFADAIRLLGGYWLTLNQQPPTVDD